MRCGPAGFVRLRVASNLGDRGTGESTNVRLDGYQTCQIRRLVAKCAVLPGFTKWGSPRNCACASELTSFDVRPLQLRS